jgi:hypothetical protein
VSFFEPPPPRPEPAREPEPVLPPWFGPPETVLGVAVATHRVLARTDTVVIALVGLTAYPTGCTFDLDLAVRRTDQDMAVWEAWQAAVFEGHHAARRVLPSGAVPDELLRCGVQLADGSKATNVGQRPVWEDMSREPSAPVFFDSGGGGGSGRQNLLRSNRGYWLWPLPSAEPFEFVIEWPLFGVPVTRTKIDGAAIVDAAARAEPLWPEGAASPTQQPSTDDSQSPGTWSRH